MTTFGDRAYHMGGVPIGLLDELCPANVFMCAKPSTPTTSYNSYEWWNARWPRDKLFTKVSRAEAACVTKQNDTILVTPESHPWYGDTHSGGEALTWDKHNTHMVGMTPGSLGGGMRSRFGHSGYTMANFITISGSSNLFANLYFMHGSSTGGASDVLCATVSGHRNVFRYVNFAGPMNQTQASSTNYVGVTISGENNYFDHCTFGVGSNSIHRDDVNCMLQFTSYASGNVFEKCIFFSRSQATSPAFIDYTNTAQLGRWVGIFKSCAFLNATTLSGSYDLADAIFYDSAVASILGFFYFDSNTSFAGVTNIMPSTWGAGAYVGSGGAGPDAGAAYDNKDIGVAQISVET